MRTLQAPATGEQSIGGGTAPAQAAGWDEDSLFLCPDRDETGFVPSAR